MRSRFLPSALVWTAFAFGCAPPPKAPDAPAPPVPPAAVAASAAPSTEAASDPEPPPITKLPPALGPPPGEPAPQIDLRIVRIGAKTEPRFLTLSPASAGQILAELTTSLGGKRARDALSAEELALLKTYAQEPLDTDEGKITARLSASEAIDIDGKRELRIAAQVPPGPNATSDEIARPARLIVGFRLSKGRWSFVGLTRRRDERYDLYRAP